MASALNKLIGNADLTREESRSVMEIIMNGEATPAQIAGVVTALRMKGETKEEITGFAEVMRAHSSHVQTSQEGLLDTCGTGGSGIHKFNISTASSDHCFSCRHSGSEAWQSGNVRQSRECRRT